MTIVYGPLHWPSTTPDLSRQNTTPSPPLADVLAQATCSLHSHVASGNGKRFSSRSEFWRWNEGLGPPSLPSFTSGKNITWKLVSMVRIGSLGPVSGSLDTLSGLQWHEQVE